MDERNGVQGEEFKKGQKKRLRTTIGFGLLIPIVLMGVVLIPLLLTNDGCMQSDDYALEKANACSAATELLGGEIEAGWWPGCGSTEVGGGMERTSWSLPVKGPNGTGTISYIYDGVGSSVRFSGQLEVGDTTINLASCGVDGAPSEICVKAAEACKAATKGSSSQSEHLEHCDVFTKPGVLMADCENTLESLGDNPENATIWFSEDGSYRIQEGRSVSETCVRAAAACKAASKGSSSKAEHMKNCDVFMKPGTQLAACEYTLETLGQNPENATIRFSEDGSYRITTTGPTLSPLCQRAGKCCIAVMLKKPPEKQKMERCTKILQADRPGSDCEALLDAYQEAADALGVVCK